MRPASEPGREDTSKINLVFIGLTRDNDIPFFNSNRSLEIKDFKSTYTLIKKIY